MASAGDGDHLGVRGEVPAADDVDGQDDLDAALIGAFQVAPARLQTVRVEEAPADLVTLCREEGEEHPTADEESVGRPHEVVDDGELVGDLGAAQDHGIRALGVLGEAFEDLDLGADQPTHRCGEPRRDVVDRRLLAVDHSEPVRHVGVGEPGEGVGELGAVLVRLRGLTLVEPQVLQEHDVAVGHGVHRRPGTLAHRVGRERHRAAEQLPEPPGDGSQRVLLLRPSLRAAEVGAHDDARPRRRRARRWSGPTPGCGRRP